MNAHGHAAALTEFATTLAAAGALASSKGKRWLAGVLRRLPRGRARTQFTAVPADSVEWMENKRYRNLVTYFMKPLFRDPGTGHSVMLVRYPAGQVNPAHEHTAGHGMYVLQGSLVTHRGTFGPDTFVWFPAREAMSHGAGADEDLVVLYIVGETMKTDYAVPAAAPSPGSPSR